MNTQFDYNLARRRWGKIAHEIHDELVLNAEETAALVRNTLHPNVEACMRRNEFLRDLSGLHIDLTNGEITATCPDIQLPSDLPQKEHCLTTIANWTIMNELMERSKAHRNAAVERWPQANGTTSVQPEKPTGRQAAICCWLNPLVGKPSLHIPLDICPLWCGHE